MMVNALNMGLIPEYLAAWHKKAVTENQMTKCFCTQSWIHAITKMISCIHVRVINSSNNGFCSWSTLTC